LLGVLLEALGLAVDELARSLSPALLDGRESALHSAERSRWDGGSLSAERGGAGQRDALGRGILADGGITPPGAVARKRPASVVR